MARMICPASGLEEPNDGTFCDPHVLRLEPAPDDAVPVDEAPAPNGAPRTCSQCGTAAVATNTVCLTCGTSLVESRLALIVQPRGGASFTVAAGQSVGLGRDPEFSQYADRFTAFGNVSRRHATLTVDAQRGAELVPRETTNPTFVNSRQIPPLLAHRLHDHDEIRFGAHFTAIVRIKPPEREERP
jgi:hypothetical protein